MELGPKYASGIREYTAHVYFLYLRRKEGMTETVLSWMLTKSWQMKKDS